MKTTHSERRDWSLLIFIVPIAILLMMIMGQIAIRMLPRWSINTGMRSNLDPDTASGHPVSLFQPILPQILTPMSWAENFLIPGQEISFPPFIVIEPTATPSPTAATPPTTTTSPTSDVTSTVSPPPSPTVIPPTTSTPRPTNDDSSPPTETVTTTPPTPTVTTTPPTPTVTTTPPTPTATSTDTPTPTEPPTPTGYPSTLDPGWSQVGPPPQINLNAPDGSPANLANGSYTVLNISTNPVIVSLTPDEFYDLVFYEFNEGGYIYMDHIIIGISQQADGSIYYEVFNWGNNVPDTNTSLDTDQLPPQNCRNPGVDNNPECDDRIFPPADLYPYPGTGILIDADTAPSAPPPGTYDYIVIISPVSGLNDPSQIDAIVVTEVPLPTP